MASNRQHFGYATLSGPEGVQECDTFTCAHCQAIVHVPPKPAPPVGGTCAQCGWKLICDACAARETCEPFEIMLRRIEASEMFRRQMGA